jgi:hypothetical protein
MARGSIVPSGRTSAPIRAAHAGEFLPRQSARIKLQAREQVPVVGNLLGGTPGEAAQPCELHLAPLLQRVERGVERRRDLAVRRAELAQARFQAVDDSLQRAWTMAHAEPDGCGEASLSYRGKKHLNVPPETTAGVERNARPSQTISCCRCRSRLW